MTFVDLYGEEKKIEMEKRFPGEKNPYLILEKKKKERRGYEIGKGLLMVIGGVTASFVIDSALRASKYPINDLGFLGHGCFALVHSCFSQSFFSKAKEVKKDIGVIEREIGGMENKVIEEEIRMENELIGDWKKEL